MKPNPMTASDFRLLPTGQQYAMYAEAFRDRAELIEALRECAAALNCEPDADACAGQNARALLSRLGADK